MYLCRFPDMILFWSYCTFIVGLISASEYGGDFSGNGLSGVDPGASAGTMGSKPASAMAIGTGKEM